MTSLYEEIQVAIHGIWNRRWIALGIAWGVALIGWLVVALIPNSYESRARIFIEPRTILSAKPSADPLRRQHELDQVRQTLTSADNLVKVVQGTALAKSVRTDADLGARVGMLKRTITITSQQDNLFEISATSSDRSLSNRANAELSAEIVRKLVDILDYENVTGSKAELGTTLKILDEQIAQRARDLAETEQRRVAFEQRIMGALPGTGSIAQRTDAIRSELSQIDMQLAAAQSALAGLNGQLQAISPTIDSPGAGGQGGGSALSQALGELAAARARGWTDEHPDVVALKRQIAALRGMGGETAVTRTSNPIYVQLRSLQAERAAAAGALQARKAELQGSLAGLAAAQARDPGLVAEQDRLDRDYAAIKDQYDKLVTDREDARLSGDVRREAGAFSFRLVDPPGVPGAPASPNRPMLLVGVLLAAIAAGVGGAFALGQLRGTYATAARLERATGLTVIGAVTETLGTAARQARIARLRLFAAGSAGLIVMCAALVALEFVQRGLAA